MMNEKIFANGNINDEEIMMNEQLDEISGGAGFKSWFQAIGGTLLGVGAAVASVANPALAGVAIVALASGAKGIVEVATE